MSKNKNMLYVLTATLAVSSLAAGIAVADNEYYDYGYPSQPVVAEQSVAQAPQVVYEEEMVMPATAIAYGEQPIVAEPQEDDGVPPKNKDGSLFPGGSCG